MSPYWNVTLMQIRVFREKLLRDVNYRHLRKDGGVGGPALQIGRSLVRFQLVSLEFFIDLILPIALWHLG